MAGNSRDLGVQLRQHHLRFYPQQTTLATDKGVERDLHWLQAPSRGILTRDDPQYPALLAQIPDPPEILYYEGRLALLEQLKIAIVGSRRATGYGRDVAARLAQQLGQLGIAVVSGLALGIDAVAHRHALASAGGTIAVLGTGIDRDYPVANRTLAGELRRQGLVLSEFPTGHAAYPANFPRRNRIVTGLCLGTVVVQAMPRSGSLISARLAGEQGREVFAVPGGYGAASSGGCHDLIRDGAVLLDDVSQIFAETLPLARYQAGQQQPAPDQALTDPARTVLEHLESEPMPLSALQGRTGMTVAQLYQELLSLELDGYVVGDALGYRRCLPIAPGAD